MNLAVVSTVISFACAIALGTIRPELDCWLRDRYTEDTELAGRDDEHQSGLTHPFDPGNPCDPSRVLADIRAKCALPNELKEN